MERWIKIGKNKYVQKSKLVNLGIKTKGIENYLYLQTTTFETSDKNHVNEK